MENSWKASSDIQNVNFYDIVRDGSYLQAIPAGGTSYTDSSVNLGETHTCYIVAKEKNSGKYSVKSNSITETICLLSDLQITEMSCNPASPKVGDKVTFTATVKNTGHAASPSGVIHGVQFFVGGTQVDGITSYTSSIPVEGTALITGTWSSATEGTHNIIAKIDMLYDRIFELDEGNNEKAISVVVEKVVVDPGPVDPGTNAYFTNFDAYSDALANNSIKMFGTALNANSIQIPITDLMGNTVFYHDYTGYFFDDTFFPEIPGTYIVKAYLNGNSTLQQIRLVQTTNTDGHNPYDIPGGIKQGVFDSSASLVKSLLHPLETFNAAISIILAIQDPNSQWGVQFQDIINTLANQTWDSITGGDSYEKGKIVGRFFGDIAIGVIGTKGMSAAVDALKASTQSGRLATLISRINSGTVTTNMVIDEVETVAGAITQLGDDLARAELAALEGATAVEEADILLEVEAKTISATEGALEPVVLKRITKAMNSLNPGVKLEGETANALGSKVINFQKNINGSGGRIGEIDIETNNAIIDCFHGLTSKEPSTFFKYFNEHSQYMNPQGKQVILYAPNIDATKVAGIETIGVKVVRTMEELQSLVR